MAGSPNVGKSTLFNVLTGSKSKVGNWPGKTVERWEGSFKYSGYVFELVDLPGTYSLRGVSEEERVSRRFLINGRYDVVLVIADMLSLEKSLYLAVQVLELTNRVVLALNKLDEAESSGFHVNVKLLSRRLGVPVVAVSAIQRRGLRELIQYLLMVGTGKLKPKGFNIDYGELEEYVSELGKIVAEMRLPDKYRCPWILVRLLEGDQEIALQAVKELGGKTADKLFKAVEKVRKEVKERVGLDPDVAFPAKRYDAVHHLLEGVVSKAAVVGVTTTERLDNVFLHPVIGPVALTAAFAAIFLLVFTFNTGFPLNVVLTKLGFEETAELLETYSLSGLLGMAVDQLSSTASAGLTAAGVPGPVVSLLCDGLLGGLGIVLSFFPLILMSFLATGFLDDTGLLARFAYQAHRLLSRLGVNGRAIVPLLFSMGCNVPGVVGSRIMETEGERRSVAMATAFIPCQARLIVMLAFATVAFRGAPFIQLLVVLALYGLGFLISALSLRLFSRRVFGAEASELVLELPPYHWPSLRVIGWHAWSNSAHFLRKAGTLIAGLNVLMWFLTLFGPRGWLGEEALENIDLAAKSWSGVLGGMAAPALNLMGVQGDGSWLAAVALIFGLMAKEAVLVVFNLASPSGDLRESLNYAGLTGAGVISYMVFMTLYTPCIATLVAIRHETGSWKYPLLTLAYQLVVAYFFSVVVCQVLLLL